MNILIASEHVIDNYILGKKMKPKAYGQYELLLVVVDVLAGDVVRAVRKGRCPFCGRVFPTKRGIARHLKVTSWKVMRIRPYGSDWFWVREVYPKNPCAFKYAKLVEYLASVYMKLRNSIRRWGRVANLRLFAGGEEYDFRNFSEVAEFIRRNPDVLRVVADVA